MSRSPALQIDAGFWRFAEVDPGAIAVIAPDEEPTAFGALLAESNRLVHGLRARGFRAGDVLAVALSNRVAYLALYFAAMQAGWHFAPLNVGMAAPEIAHVLADCGASALVFGERSHAAVAAALDSAGIQPSACFCLDPIPGFPHYDDLVRGQTADTPTERVAGEKLYYTSGTTGRPCGVKRPLTGEPPETCGVAAAAHLAAMVGIAPHSGAVHLVASPLYHSASLLWATDHLHLGHTVVLTDRWDARGTLERIERYGVTGTFMVPTHFHRLLALPDAVRGAYDLSSLRHVVHAGAPCPAEIKRRMLAWWGPVIYEVYGAAEGGGVGISPGEWVRKPGSVGRGGNSVRILREDGEVCAPGEIGAVYLKLTRPFAYHNHPEKTARGRRGDYFTVGDLGRVDDEGYLFLSGRSGEVIITGGVNVYPAEVEAVLASHPGVADAAVIGVPDEEWGERVVAVVEAMSGAITGADLERELRDYSRERLSSAKCPKAVRFVEALPRNPNGKLHRQQLFAMASMR